MWRKEKQGVPYIFLKNKTRVFSPLRKLATPADPLSARKISYDAKQAVEGDT